MEEISRQNNIRNNQQYVITKRNSSSRNKHTSRHSEPAHKTHILHVPNEMQDPPPNVLHSDDDVDMSFPVPLEALDQAEGRSIISGIVLRPVNVLRHGSGLVPVRPVYVLKIGRERGHH